MPGERLFRYRILQASGVAHYVCIWKSLHQFVLGELPAPKFPTCFSSDNSPTICKPSHRLPVYIFFPPGLSCSLSDGCDLCPGLVLIIIHPRYPDLHRARAHTLIAEASALTTYPNLRIQIQVPHHPSLWRLKETSSPGKALSP